MEKSLKLYEVWVGAEADSLEERFEIRATYPKAAEFDAMQEAAKRFPFVDPCDLVILGTTKELK